MFETKWNVRKYQLRDYNSETLHLAIINWAKRQGQSVFYRSPVIFNDGLRQVYSTFTSGTTLLIHYEGSMLFVFTCNRLPIALANIHEEVITPYVLEGGGSPLEEPPIVFETLFVFESPVKKLKELSQGYNPQQGVIDPRTSLNYVVHLQPNLELTEATAQVVSVPPGVSITVTRSRAVEHTLNVNWTTAVDIEVGLRGIITASIHGKIEQVQGTTYKETETITFDVELKGGDKGNNYRLVFFDAWRKGVAEVQLGNKVSMLPFQFREGAELRVIPLEANRVP